MYLDVSEKIHHYPCTCYRITQRANNSTGSDMIQEQDAKVGSSKFLIMSRRRFLLNFHKARE